jgi:uncharacterized protein YecE (DUF72 family)
MRVHVGTSGYSFPEWKGSFYPEGLPAAAMLPYYAARFPTVEINNTFYRMPKESVVVEWAAAVPDGFSFSIKASQRITHHARLKDVDDMMQYLLRVCTALGDKRGPTLFQLPPNMKLDLERLAAFLPLIPRRWKAAIEFRHATWHADDVYALLRQHEVALVAAESEDTEAVVTATAPYGYLRLHKPAYTPDELDSWVTQIGAQLWDEAWVYFKHDTDTAGPELAAAFATRFA